MEGTLRKFGAFVDGMARAMIIPFGPELINKITRNQSDGHGWTSISIPLALTIATFIVGHAFGEILAVKMPYFSEQRFRARCVAQVGGAALALHCFSWGAGFTSVSYVMMARYFYAVMVGILRVITTAGTTTTSTGKSPETLPLMAQPDNVSTINTSIVPLDISISNAKYYLFGFGISVITGGWFFLHVSANLLVQKLTSTFEWAPFFFVASSLVFSLILSGMFGDTLDRSRSLRGVTFEQNYQDPSESDPDSLRQRTASMASVNSSEYYDCHSQFSEDGVVKQSDEMDENEVAQYVNGRCCYSDGTPAFVPPGDRVAVIPDNYLENCNGDRNRALKMWQDTQKWRREKEVWRIHTMPNRFYRDIVQAYPHFAHGFSKNGLAVMYEQPGKMNLKALFRGECTIDDMVHHYIFFNEFLSNCLCASPELRKAAGKESKPYSSADYGILVVMDIGGAGISMLSTDVVKYLNSVSAVNQAHYPNSMKRVCVVNCPFWASGVFSQIKKILPASVQAELFSASDFTNGLRQYIDDDQIPPEYGGSSPYRLGEHPFTKQLSKLVDAAAYGAGMDFDEEAVVSVALEGMLSSPGRTRKANGYDSHEESDASVRRRSVQSTVAQSAKSPSYKTKKSAAYENVDVVDTLSFAWFFLFCCSGIQGAIESAIPLWLTCPIELGGLGYPPRKSGKNLSLAALISIVLLNTPFMVSRFSQHYPVRTLRTGLLLESAALLLLIIFAYTFEGNTPVKDIQIILILTVGTMAGMLARYGSSSLSIQLAHGLSESSLDRASVCSIEYLIAEFTSLGAVKFVTVIAEVIGVFVSSQVWVLAVDRQNQAKLNGVVCFMVPCLLAGFLCSLSWFLRAQSMPKARSDA